MPRMGKEPGMLSSGSALLYTLFLCWYLSEPQFPDVNNEGRWPVGFFQPLIVMMLTIMTCTVQFLGLRHWGYMFSIAGLISSCELHQVNTVAIPFYR